LPRAEICRGTSIAGRQTGLVLPFRQPGQYLIPTVPVAQEANQFHGVVELAGRCQFEGKVRHGLLSQCQIPQPDQRNHDGQAIPDPGSIPGHVE
jgi:hypothetical protein